jgi:hypothetical protein
MPGGAKEGEELGLLRGIHIGFAYVADLDSAVGGSPVERLPGSGRPA